MPLGRHSVTIYLFKENYSLVFSKQAHGNGAFFKMQLEVLKPCNNPLSAECSAVLQREIQEK